MTLYVIAHTAEMNYYMLLSRHAYQYKLTCKHLMMIKVLVCICVSANKNNMAMPFPLGYDHDNVSRTLFRELPPIIISSTP